MAGVARVLCVLALVLTASAARTAEEVALDNDYVHVSKNEAPCANAATPGCGDRIIVAMGDLALKSGTATRTLARGGVAVFKPGESYEPPAGAYFEVAIKPGHPPVKSPAEMIPPAKNAIVYDGDSFFVYEERLAVGDTRARHSHSQRVEIRINQGPMLEQWRDGDTKPFEPGVVAFREAMIHTTKNVGDMPLFNIIIEFRPEKAAAR